MLSEQGAQDETKRQEVVGSNPFAAVEVAASGQTGQDGGERVPKRIKLEVGVENPATGLSGALHQAKPPSASSTLATNGEQSAICSSDETTNPQTVSTQQTTVGANKDNGQGRSDQTGNEENDPAIRPVVLNANTAASPSSVLHPPKDGSSNNTHSTPHCVAPRSSPPPTAPPPQPQAKPPPPQQPPSQQLQPPQQPKQSQPPPRPATMADLKTKFMGELDYMLREFRKLERQLLGAKSATQMEESAGSRERREKLHSFILHLEDTIQQIELGCKLEAEGKSTAMVGISSNVTGKLPPVPTGKVAEEQEKPPESMDGAPPGGKAEGDNVLRLEQHILANLLPVKVRLKKQLAAQQGATRNPAGMPAPRRGMLQPSSGAERGKGTFAEAAEQRRKQEEAARQTALEKQQAACEADKTQFGKPLNGSGSFLTQKLHGSTLGSKNRLHGHGVGSPEPKKPPQQLEGPSDDEGDKPKILYAGMALGSEQMHSSVSAAAGVHKVIIENPSLIRPIPEPAASTTESKPALASADADKLPAQEKPQLATQTTKINARAPVAPQSIVSAPSALAPTVASVAAPSAAVAAAIPVPVAATSTATVAPTPASAAATTVAAVPATPTPAATTPAATSAVAVAAATGNRATKTVAAPASQPTKNEKDSPLTIEERKALRRKRRKKRLLRRAKRREKERQRQQMLHEQAIQAAQMPKGSMGRRKSASGKGQGKKKGPRGVEYICALCSDVYNSTCEFNPWWALAQHECPKCRKTQVPRVDITAPANAIEYHPALLAHIEDAGVIADIGDAAGAQTNPSHLSPVCAVSSQGSQSRPQKHGSDSDSGSGLSDMSDDDLSVDSLSDSDSSLLQAMTPAERAEYETFGYEYKGPVLSDKDASRLLVLMEHASTCPCRHKSTKHRDVCRSMKYLMLHVRDCPGTTSTFDVCPFPWCRKVKHLLFHLVSCIAPHECPICSPTALSTNLSLLVGLNGHRTEKSRGSRIASAKATAAVSSSSSSEAQAESATSVSPALTKKEIGKRQITKMPPPYNKNPPRVEVTKMPPPYNKNPPKPSTDTAAATKPADVATPPVVASRAGAALPSVMAAGSATTSHNLKQATAPQPGRVETAPAVTAIATAQNQAMAPQQLNKNSSAELPPATATTVPCRKTVMIPEQPRTGGAASATAATTASVATNHTINQAPMLEQTKTNSDAKLPAVTVDVASAQPGNSDVVPVSGQKNQAPVLEQTKTNSDAKLPAATVDVAPAQPGNSDVGQSSSSVTSIQDPKREKVQAQPGVLPAVVKQENPSADLLPDHHNTSPDVSAREEHVTKGGASCNNGAQPAAATPRAVEPGNSLQQVVDSTKAENLEGEGLRCNEKDSKETSVVSVLANGPSIKIEEKDDLDTLYPSNNNTSPEKVVVKVEG